MAINRIKTGGITDGTIQSGDIAPGTIASDRLEGSVANAKLANSSITINGTAVALGGSVTAGTDWQAVTVADGSTQLTAVAGKGYILDTNTGVIEVSLPTSPSRGDTIVLADYGGNFSTNNVIVDAGSNLIDSVETAGFGQGYVLSTNNLIVELVYVDSSKGWLVQENEAKSSLTAADDSNSIFTEATGGTVTTSGNFKIHTFTGDGNFVVSKVGNSGGSSDKVSYLVIGGGSAGGYDRGGGGGAGGYREGKVSSGNASDPYSASPIVAPDGLQISAQTYPITVGGGSAASNQSSTAISNGSNSIFSTITAAGGGGAGNPGSPHQNGAAGGSGGGARDGPYSGGAGNTPPVSPSQGFPGGSATSNQSGPGGGGGGATQAGFDGAGNPSQPTMGDGGAGATSSINGTPTARAGGGGSGGGGSIPAGGVGGTGGGGNGANQPAGPQQPSAGTANTGSGGGAGNGGPSQCGQAGGKGIVIIRYKYQAG